MPRIEIDQDRCKGCELCTIPCPKELVKMSDRFNRKGYRTSELVEPETPNQIVLDRRKDRRYLSLVVTGAVLIVGGIASMGWASLRKNSTPNT